MKLRIVKNIRGNVHCLDIGHVGDFEDVFAKQLIAAGGAVEVVDTPGAEAAVIQPPENAMKKLSPSAARKPKT